VLQKSKEVWRCEFNDISRWLRVLVCSLKESEVWKIKKVDEYGCEKESQIMDQPKKHGREKAWKSQFSYKYGLQDN